MSLLLFAASLTQSAVEFEKVCRNSETRKVEAAGLWGAPLGPVESMSGLKLLLVGGFGVLFVQLGAVGWLANALYFLVVALWLTKEESPIKWLVLASLIVAASSLPLTNLFPIAADEGIVCYFSAIRPEVGYWLWLAAISALNVAAWLGARNATRNADAQKRHAL